MQLLEVGVVGDLADLHVGRHTGPVAPLIVGLGHGGLDVSQIHDSPLRRHIALTDADIGVLAKDGATRRSHRRIGRHGVRDQASGTQHLRRVGLDHRHQLLRAFNPGLGQLLDLAHLLDLVDRQALQTHERVGAAFPSAEGISPGATQHMQATPEHATKGDVERGIGHAVVGLLIAGSAIDDRLDHRSTHQTLGSADAKARQGAGKGRATGRGQQRGIAGLAHDRHEGRRDVDGVE